MTATIAGVRFSDQMGALFTHALANGFRIEKDTRGKNAKGLVIYPPDPNHGPITVDERGARFNRAHYENCRRDLYRAGLPPLPTDKSTPSTQEAAEAAVLADAPPGSRPLRLGGSGFGMVETPDITEHLDDPTRAPEMIGAIAQGLATRIGIGVAESALVASLVQCVAEWSMTFGEDRLSQLRTEIMDGLVADHKKEMAAMQALAEEAEAARVAADRDREKAEARGAETGRLLTEALAAKDTAEAEARRLNAAIAPLRALMSSADA